MLARGGVAGPREAPARGSGGRDGPATEGSGDMDIDREQARNVLAGVASVFGVVGWVAPGALARLYGLQTERDATLPFLLRLFAARQLLLAAGVMRARPDDLDRIFDAMALMGAADAAAAVVAGARGQVPRRSAAMATATSVLIGAYAKASSAD